MVTLPTYDQVRALPCVLDRVVEGPHVDGRFSHLTVTGHLDLHVAASAALLDRIRLDASPGASPRRSVMDLEHHLRYLTEVPGGVRVAVHERLLARAVRRFHGIRFLVDVTNARLADTFEFVSVHVDLDAHRAVPFDPAVARRLDEAIAAGQHVPWPAPRCGALGLDREPGPGQPAR